MDKRLVQPRWMLAHTVVLSIAVLFIFLGSWQLRRHDERTTLNEMGEARLSASVEDVDALFSTDDPESLEYRRVEISGEFDIEHQVLIRSQVYRGTAGFHVITPLVTESRRAVLVNRGWVPLDYQGEKLGSPSDGTTIEGWVQLKQERPPLGPEDPSQGVLETLNRVDIDRIAQQLPMTLAPVYVVLIGEQGGDLPIPLKLPTFEDQGPHLAYAIQWFGFALVGLVGYFFLARRRLGYHRSSGSARRAKPDKLSGERSPPD